MAKFIVHCRQLVEEVAELEIEAETVTLALALAQAELDSKDVDWRDGSATYEASAYKVERAADHSIVWHHDHD